MVVAGRSVSDDDDRSIGKECLVGVGVDVGCLFVAGGDGVPPPENVVLHQ